MTKPIQMRLSSDLLARIDAVIDPHGLCSRTDVVRAALAAFLPVALSTNGETEALAVATARMGDVTVVVATTAPVAKVRMAKPDVVGAALAAHDAEWAVPCPGCGGTRGMHQRGCKGR